MFRKVCALAATMAFFLAASSRADEPKGLTQGEVTAAMTSNPDLNEKTYDHVDFHVLDESGEIGKVVTLYAKTAMGIDVSISSVAIKLPQGQWCAAGNVVPGAGTVVYWCDPGNNNKLQSDIFQMKFNGSKGQYLISYQRIDCTTEKADIPPDIWSALCT
jgi:hypothetical protein